MKINCFYILVFGVNVIVCLPQPNQHESILNVTAENGNKSTEDERSLNDNLKDKEGIMTDAINIKNKVQENTTEIVDTKEKVGIDVLNMSKGMYTNQRLIPISYDPAEQAVPHRWLPVPPRYIIPIVPRESEQVFTPTYDEPFEKDVRAPEIVAEPHFNEPIIKNPSSDPIETVYVVPPNRAYTSGPPEAIIPTRYLASIPVDPNGYDSQETGVLTKAWLYPPPFVQPRYYRINGQQPYYRQPVHPLARYNPVNVFPPPFNYGTALYQEPLLPTTLEEKSTGDLHEQGLHKSVEDNNDRRKHQIIVPRKNLTDFVRNIPNNNKNNNGYPIYYPGKPHNADNHNKNSQSNNKFESPDIDTTMIYGYVNDDFNDFDRGHHMYFPPNSPQSHPQVIYSPYQNLEPKGKLENTMNNSDDSGIIQNDDNVTRKLDINGRNHQGADNPGQDLKINNDYEILHERKRKESLSDVIDMSYNNSYLNHASVDGKIFANDAKNATINERKDKKQEFDYVDNTKQHEKPDTSMGSTSKEVIESNKSVFNDKIESKKSTTNKHMIITDNTENLSTALLKTHSEDKNQESLNIDNKKEYEMMSTEIRIPESFESMESNESTIKSQVVYSNEYIHKDSTETPSTETTVKIKDSDNKTSGVYEKDVIIETTQLQPSYDIEKKHYDDQDTGTLQSIASLDDSNRVTAGTENVIVQIVREENSLINRNKINSNQTIETTTVNTKEINTANDVQPIKYMEKIDEGQDCVDDSVEVTIQKDNPLYNTKINIYQVENKTTTPENLKPKKSSENNDEGEHKKLSPNNITFENTFSAITSDNSNSQESGENSEYRNPQIEGKKYDKENFNIISDVILNLNTVESNNKSNNNSVGDKDLVYFESERSTNNSSSQDSDEKSDRGQSQIKGATHIDKENNNINNKNWIFETIPNIITVKDEINISKKESESNTELDENEDYVKNNKNLKIITIDNTGNDVKPSSHNPGNLGKAEIEGIKLGIENKNPVVHTHEKEDTWYNDKDDVAIDVNLSPKITEYGEITKFKEQSGNDSNSENRSEAIDIKLAEEVATAIDKTTCPDHGILASFISDTDANENNDDDLNDDVQNNDDFDEISSATKITNEQSIESKLGFKTTCIRYPVDISINDDSKNTTEPMRLEFYRKLFEEYYKNRNVIPLTVIQKDIRNFVYKNGKVVNVIASTVWNVENDEKPVELRTTITYQTTKNKKM